VFFITSKKLSFKNSGHRLEILILSIFVSSKICLNSSANLFCCGFLVSVHHRAAKLIQVMTISFHHVETKSFISWIISFAGMF
jgi:hypothetical protein